MTFTILFLVNTIAGYLIGSVCSAIIVCQLFDLPDPRQKGSKNPGATNVLRLAGKHYASIVLVADMLKGLLPLLLAHALDAGPTIMGFTCLAAVLGHMYPLFFNFKGGKGVATALGALLGFHVVLGSMVIVTWLVVAYISKYSSLASLIALLLAPFFALLHGGSPDAFLPLIVMSLLIVYKHRDNIARLVDGTESKISFRQSTSSTPPPGDNKSTPAKKKAPKAATTTMAKKPVKKEAKPAKKQSTKKLTPKQGPQDAE